MLKINKNQTLKLEFAVLDNNGKLTVESPGSVDYSINKTLELAVSDYIEIYALHSSVSAVNIGHSAGLTFLCIDELI